MKVVIVCGDVKPEVIIEVGGILSNCEFNPNYDYSDDLERVEETYGREAVLDALCYLSGDDKLTEQANYFNCQLLTDEYSYFVERMIGASNENDDW